MKSISVSVQCCTIIRCFYLFVQFSASCQYSQQMAVENRQSHTLFGVAGLFVLGHMLRILLNLHEMANIKRAAESNCLAAWPLWAMVSMQCQPGLNAPDPLTHYRSCNCCHYCLSNVRNEWSRVMGTTRERGEEATRWQGCQKDPVRETAKVKVEQHFPSSQAAPQGSPVRIITTGWVLNTAVTKCAKGKANSLFSRILFIGNMVKVERCLWIGWSRPRSSPGSRCWPLSQRWRLGVVWTRAPTTKRQILSYTGDLCLSIIDISSHNCHNAFSDGSLWLCSVTLLAGVSLCLAPADDVLLVCQPVGVLRGQRGLPAGVRWPHQAGLGPHRPAARPTLEQAKGLQQLEQPVLPQPAHHRHHHRHRPQHRERTAPDPAHGIVRWKKRSCCKCDKALSWVCSALVF